MFAIEFEIYTILANAKTPGKTFADDRLVIRRGVVLFRIEISRLADEFFRLILVKQPAQV